MFISIKRLLAFIYVIMLFVSTVLIVNNFSQTDNVVRARSGLQRVIPMNEQEFGFDREVEAVVIENLNEDELVDKEGPYEPDMLLPRLFFWL